jgi:hypothetical protein
MLTSLAVGAGVDGLPFAEDIMDLIDTIAQRVFGSPFNSKRAIRNIAKTASEAMVGADLSSVVLNGVVNEVTGMSFASRVGLGNLIPALASAPQTTTTRAQRTRSWARWRAS